MRRHNNSDSCFTIQNETVLQRVDYDNFESKKPFQNPNSSLEYLNLCQPPLQLDIEVEINESLLLLLNSTNSSTSRDLIDVTLIRDTPSHPETTVSLGKSEVKSFLAMVSRKQEGRNLTSKTKIRRSRTEQRNISNKLYNLFSSDEDSKPSECPSCGFHNDQTESLYTNFSEQTFDNLPNGYQTNRHEKIYASPDMFTKMRTSLACQHNRKYKNENEKPGTPCLCQHCGMIGVLIESQKRPFIPHPETKEHRARSEYRKERGPRTVIDSNHEYSSRRAQENYNTQARSMTKESLFEDLLSKLQSLETRVLAQEEKAIGKDYFKYVIRKLLSQYMSNMVQSELPENVKSSATQYNRILLEESEIGEKKSHKQRRRLQQRANSPRMDSSCINSRRESLKGNLSVNNESRPRYNEIPEASSNRSRKNKNVRYSDEEAPISRRKHWKDIRTEKDLKDRIVSLIKKENSSKNGKTPEVNISPAKLTAAKEIKVESFQNTLYLPQVIHSGRVLVESEETQTKKDRNVTSSALKDLLDNMSSQIYEDIIKSKSSRSHSPLDKEEKPQYKNMQKALDDTLFKRNIEATKKREMQSANNSRRAGEKTTNTFKSEQLQMPRMQLKRSSHENLDVKYLKPVGDIWGESSNADFVKPICQEIIDKTDNRILPTDSLTYKIEYLKGLAQSKNINESDLWRSIWCQTKNRFKSKNDILTISIPSRKRTKRPIELELTWSDLKEIMRSTRAKSSREVSSCDLLQKQKQKRENMLHQNEYIKKNHSYKHRSKSVK